MAKVWGEGMREERGGQREVWGRMIFFVHCLCKGESLTSWCLEFNKLPTDLKNGKWEYILGYIVSGWQFCNFVLLSIVAPSPRENLIYSYTTWETRIGRDLKMHSIAICIPSIPRYRVMINQLRKVERCCKMLHYAAHDSDSDTGDNGREKRVGKRCIERGTMIKGLTSCRNWESSGGAVNIPFYTPLAVYISHN